MTENVIFTYDGDYQPQWQYYSMPHSCIGGGDSPEAARSSYRDSLAFQLQVDVAELPTIREHIEIEAYDGVYVRYASGSPLRARGAKLVADLLRTPFYDRQLQVSLHSSTTAAGYPVIVIAEPDDSISSVVSQMTDQDSLWLALPIEAVPVASTGDAGGSFPLLGLLPIVGSHAEDADDPDIVELDRKQLQTVNVESLFQLYAQPQGMRLPGSAPTVASRVKIPALA